MERLSDAHESLNTREKRLEAALQSTIASSAAEGIEIAPAELRRMVLEQTRSNERTTPKAV